MDTLRWWLVLLAAVMFSMSGCASNRQWNEWAGHPTHYASGNHWEFSSRTGGEEPEGAITEADREVAQNEGWWGDLVPGPPPADLSGNWVGTWKGLGLFDALRHYDAKMTLMQQGRLGVGHLHLDNTIAAGVPWVIRQEGSLGVRLVYRVTGNDAVMRHVDGANHMTAAFTLIDGRLVGTMPGGDPVVITLTRIQ